MVKRLLTLTAFLLGAVSAFAYDPAIRDIDITVRLCPENGAALVTEKWDVTVASGTEWYLVRHNLGAADISDLSVFDENGAFRNIGRWDIDASLQEKAGKCGLYRTEGGYEICWGVGSYGDHQYEVRYMITDAVDLLEDADVFHFQLVSPGLSAVPQHVRAKIEIRDVPVDSVGVRFWGFGYNGSTALEDGALHFESDEFTRNSSLIALARFDKGTFASGNEVAKPFQAVLDRAMEGADFGKDEERSVWSKIKDVLLGLLPVLLFSFFCIFSIRSGGVSRFQKKRILGVKEKDVTWSRDIPYDGSLIDTDYTLTRLGAISKKKNIASAFMLRMIYKGVLEVRKDAKGNTEFAIVKDASTEYMEEQELAFYNMLVTASGEDAVLQDKEFSKWARRNGTMLYKWSTGLSGKAADKLAFREELDKFSRYTTRGQEKARQALGFKKFLDDFTNMAEKQSVEAVLWQEYLVYAALFGTASKVAKEMKDIDPDAFSRMMPTATAATWPDILVTTDTFGRHVNNGVTAGRPVSTGPTHSSSWGGGGGFSSMGGGGGFHGGGFGGGSR